MQISNVGELLAVRDIDATLQFGQCFSSKKWTVLFVSLFATFGIGVLIALVGYIIDFSDKESIWMLIGSACAGLLVFFPYLYINSGKRKVKLWLQDSVILKARTNKAGETLEVRMFAIFAKATAIQIRFSYMGKRYVKSSIQKGKISCIPVFNKYVDKDILIAYSPIYDQVMLIKPKSEQRIRSEMSK